MLQQPISMNLLFLYVSFARTQIFTSSFYNQPPIPWQGRRDIGNYMKWCLFCLFG